MEGLVLFNKPAGITSFKVVEYFKNKLNKKIGHGGTLDPFAKGLLILGIGEFTKELNQFLKNSKKTYLAEIFLGAISSTYDLEGEIQLTYKPLPKKEKIENVIKNFEGEIEQTPPPYSAIKIKGQPLYKLARKGIDVSKIIETKKRKVKIDYIKIIDYQPPILKIETQVSSGTYIRSLANDIGEKLGCGGYLKDLIRTKINEFSLESALSFEDFEKDFLELYAKVYGRVQGVNYRYFTKKSAENLNLKGYVKNLEDGSVEVLAQGREEELQKLIYNLKEGPPLAKVEKMEIIFRKPNLTFTDFQIIY